MDEDRSKKTRKDKRVGRQKGRWFNVRRSGGEIKALGLVLGVGDWYAGRHDPTRKLRVSHTFTCHGTSHSKQIKRVSRPTKGAGTVGGEPCGSNGKNLIKNSRIPPLLGRRVGVKTDISARPVYTGGKRKQKRKIGRRKIASRQISKWHRPR